METTCLVMLLYLIWTGSMMGGASCGDYLPGYVFTCNTSFVLGGGGGGLPAGGGWGSSSQVLWVFLMGFYGIYRFGNLGLGWVSLLDVWRLCTALYPENTIVLEGAKLVNIGVAPNESPPVI